jgi:hypothetical protein
MSGFVKHVVYTDKYSVERLSYRVICTRDREVTKPGVSILAQYELNGSKAYVLFRRDSYNFYQVMFDADEFSKCCCIQCMRMLPRLGVIEDYKFNEIEKVSHHMCSDLTLFADMCSWDLEKSPCMSVYYNATLCIFPAITLYDAIRSVKLLALCITEGIVTSEMAHVDVHGCDGEFMYIDINGSVLRCSIIYGVIELLERVDSETISVPISWEKSQLAQLNDMHEVISSDIHQVDNFLNYGDVIGFKSESLDLNYRIFDELDSRTIRMIEHFNSGGEVYLAYEQEESDEDSVELF